MKHETRGMRSTVDSRFGPQSVHPFPLSRPSGFCVFFFFLRSLFSLFPSRGVPLRHAENQFKFLASELPDQHLLSSRGVVGPPLFCRMDTTFITIHGWFGGFWLFSLNKLQPPNAH